MLSALVFAALVAAAPSPSRPISLPLNAPRAPVDDLAAARHEHKRALAKYGYGGREKRDIDLKSWGYGYTVSVQVGTPPQTFDVMPDTGSFDFWLIGTCDNSTECGLSDVYRTSASSTFQATNMPFQAGPYADGGVQRGVWGYDVVAVGGQALNASVGVSTQTLNWRLAMDGIMGFGPAMTSPATPPWWFGAVGAWTDKQFGMHLGRVPPNSAANVSGVAGYGDLTLGGVNSALFAGEITYYPLVHDSASTHWEIPMRAVVAGAAVGAAIPALIDSGTTLIIGPAAYVEAFYAALPTPVRSLGSGQYVYRVAPLRAALSFGDGAGDTYALDEDDLCRVRGSRAWYAVNGVELPEDGDWCLGGITGQGSLQSSGNVDTGEEPMAELDHWIVGNAFLKNVYAAYRADPPAVGFAALTPEANRKYDGGVKPQTTTARAPAATVTVVDSGARAAVPSIALLVAALVLAW
ncbi:acid protease [Cutaneotrichosporon oleaginosum]|uniref:Acid protease n=1 Tax=Cutaneotrichosporon oleaginosum TaxID=879819 RepID=A0A0J1BE39_9TREE|nr:acid protease [Cutaneotrichosporon oleaginosum]KLT46334.1 acid protease [Cutaneotrichosporon oleaginosum]TXT15294.1 hypothetical protein COLE_01487 [Cutaneotrichosporon oleaginosum]